MRRSLALAVMCSTACGRFGFDATEPAEVDAPPPPPIDVAPVTTRCGEGPTLFCDGFESGGLDAWSGNTGAGTLVVGNDTPYLGGFSLRATAGAGGFAYGALSMAPVDTGELYLRLHLRIPSAASIAPGEGIQLFQIGRESDPGHIHFMLDPAGAPVIWSATDKHTGGTPLPRDRWLCLTTHLAIDAANGVVELALDDVKHVDITGMPLASGSGGYDEVSVGIVSTDAAQTQLSLLVDEVAVATTPLACTP